ncbi:MAG TPA: methylmalonyl-CoA epimerase [Polyangia bacterium]
MLKVKNIDHIAIVVGDLDPVAAQLSSLFGLAASAKETVVSQKTDVMFLQPPALADGPQVVTAVELCCPAGNPTLDKFLAKRGPGLHHICFEVDDIAAALDDVRAAQVELIDEVPRIGARGHLVAFLHPRATGGVLYELCQKVEGDRA